jgi:type IV pilus assembly protein PilA
MGDRWYIAVRISPGHISIQIGQLLNLHRLFRVPMRGNMHRQKGFSLIELLIVVAIIMIIAAIAIPNFLRSRMQANEASAVGSMRNINSAQITYSVNYATVGYADNLSKLGPPGGGTADANHADLLDGVLGCASQPCSKSGYRFSVVNATGSPVASYELTAVPLGVDKTGRRGFCSSQLIIIMQDETGGTSCTQVVQ